jgi:CheY-like chemotaxis protein
MAKILAIESDPERIVILRRLVSEKLDADVIVADSIESAIATLDAKRPDVIVTSSLLSPGDDQQLADHLRNAPSLDHLPVLTLPPLVDTDDAGSRDGLMSRLFRRRRRQSWPAYDADAVAARIDDALKQSKRDAPRYADLWQRPARLLLMEPEEPAQEETSLVYTLDADLARFLGIQPQQDRAPRWERSDLLWLENIRLTWGANLHLLNMSSSGLLVESGIRMTVGNLEDFEFEDREERDYVMSGRVVRSDVATVTNLGVKYITAAVFDKPFESIGPDNSLPPQRAYRRLLRRRQLR